MKQPYQSIKDIVLFVVVCVVFMNAQILFAENEANNITFPEINGTNPKSDTTFYIMMHLQEKEQAPAAFTAAAGHKLSDGIEVTATGSQYPVKLIPITISEVMEKGTANASPMRLHPVSISSIHSKAMASKKILYTIILPPHRCIFHSGSNSIRCWKPGWIKKAM